MKSVFLASSMALILTGAAFSLAPLSVADELEAASTPEASLGVETGAPAEPTSEPVPVDMDAEIRRLNKFVRSIRSIEGKFVQTAENGRLETGTFYWNRPAKLRIEYDQSPLLIVADGRNIAQIDKDLETIDQVRISWTPYKFLLRRKFDLTRGMDLVGIQKMPHETRVTVRDPDEEIDGEFTLIFAEPELAFLGWTWTNPFDGQVDFILRDAVEGNKLAASMFVIREEERRRGGRRR
ncbi:MAG: hypothetical protein COA47_00405 [Robiginitomaculum sp.]|nr:MAG: hypothetical protein COA47_00405 [Robiginitomaculum sp.]